VSHTQPVKLSVFLKLALTLQDQLVAAANCSTDGPTSCRVPDVPPPCFELVHR
jgi:hypothetical protein